MDASEHIPDPPEDHREVEVFVNDQPHLVIRGRWSVSDLKQACHVPQADELELIDGGVLKPLPDDGHVVIHGGERFIAHPRTGGAS